MNIFDGLLGYEKLMLICGFVLFVFALAAITVMIVQRRDFKAAMGLFVFAILLMGFPGIQAVKVSRDMVELDHIRAQPPTPADPEQKQQAQQVLGNLEQRAADNPQLQAKVADGYRAIGDVDKGYQLAQAVLQQKPSAQVQATLVPVLTAKLNQVQAGAPVAAAPTPAPASSAPIGGAMPPPPPPAASAVPASGGTLAGAPPAVPEAAAPAASAPVDSSRQHEIATIAKQLQGTGVPLPAASHAALAKAYVVLGQPRKAQANIEAARRLDPHIKINAAVLRAVGAGSVQRPPGG